MRDGTRMKRINPGSGRIRLLIRGEPASSAFPPSLRDAQRDPFAREVRLLAGPPDEHPVVAAVAVPVRPAGGVRVVGRAVWRPRGRESRRRVPHPRGHRDGLLTSRQAGAPSKRPSRLTTSATTSSGASPAYSARRDRQSRLLT